MGSPFPLLAIICIYLWIVFQAAPAYMKNRQAYNLTWIVRIYNAFQVYSCLRCILKFDATTFYKQIWNCHIYQQEESTLILGWYYLILRMTELLETIFFALRKKQSQITGLHVYHHVVTVVLYWLFYKYDSGEKKVNIYFNVFNYSVNFQEQWV